MYKQGDIIFVPFSFSDEEKTKQRPVVVISKDSINNRSYIVVKITSVLNKSIYGMPIYQRDVDFTMDKTSEIITNDIMTISENRIIKRLGKMKRDALTKLIDRIQDNFEIE